MLTNYTAGTGDVTT